jgi:hypothetical protein
MINHLSSIRSKKKTSIAAHFNKTGHNLSHFKFFAIETNSSWTEEKRMQKEGMWINRLNTFFDGENETQGLPPRNIICLPHVGRKIIPEALRTMTDLKFCTSINDNLGKSLVKSRNRITKST